MIEAEGSEVKITLITGQIIKGFINSWTREKVVISYNDSNNKTTIFNPNENVIMLSVYGDKEKPLPNRESNSPIHQGEKNVIVEPEIKPKYHGPDQELKNAELVELHEQRNQAVKEQLSHLLKNKTPKPDLGVKYGAPDFSK